MFIIELTHSVLKAVSSNFFDIPNPFTTEKIFNDDDMKFQKNNDGYNCYHSSSKSFNSIKSTPHDLSIHTQNICYLLTSMGGFPEINFSFSEIPKLARMEITYLRVLLAVSYVNSNTTAYINPIHALIPILSDFGFYPFKSITTDELALMYDVSAITARRWCNARLIFATKQNSEWYVDIDTALNFVPPLMGRPPQNA